MKILIADKLDSEALTVFNSQGIAAEVKTGLSEEQLISAIGDYDGIIVRSGVTVTAKIIAHGTNLKVIGRAGVGVDNIDVKAATARGIVVMNTPFGNVNSAAEHTIAMILGVSRHIHTADKTMKSGAWERKKFEGNELRGKTVGIIGLGNVGKIVARILKSFDAVLIGYDPFVTQTTAQEIGVQLAALPEIYSQADYITLHVPLNENTKNMIAAPQFEMMKKGVKIINVGRGGLVDEQALYEALEEQKVAGAALDVWEHEPLLDFKLAGHERVLATPHLGASTVEAQKSVAVDIARQVSDFLLNGTVSGAVNFHSIKSEQYHGLRPYIPLAQKLGSICIGLSDGGLERIEVHYRGKIAEMDTKILTNYVVKGVLKRVCQDTVNEVNALHIAAQRNIKVVESSSDVSENFANLMRVMITTDAGTYKVNGTVFDDKKERIVKINDFDIDMTPKGTLIISQNFDRPGVIGAIGSILGATGINISHMAVGRTSEKGRSLNVTMVDSDVPPEVVEKLRGANNVTEVRIIKV